MKDFFATAFVSALLFVTIFLVVDRFMPKAPSGLGTNEVVVHEDQVVPPVVDPVIDLDGHDRIESPRLSAYAQDWAETMAQNHNFNHSHVSSLSGRHGTVRENIAYIRGEGSWEACYKMWVESPPHDFNIKNGGKYLGYGEATNRGVTYYVVIYAEKP